MGIERQRQAARFFTEYDGVEIANEFKRNCWSVLQSADMGKISRLQRLEAIDQTLIKIAAIDEFMAMISQIALASDNDDITS